MGYDLSRLRNLDRIRNTSCAIIHLCKKMGTFLLEICLVSRWKYDIRNMRCWLHAKKRNQKNVDIGDRTRDPKGTSQTPYRYATDTPAHNPNTTYTFAHINSIWVCITPDPPPILFLLSSRNCHEPNETSLLHGSKEDLDSDHLTPIQTWSSHTWGSTSKDERV